MNVQLGPDPDPYIHPMGGTVNYYNAFIRPYFTNIFGTFYGESIQIFDDPLGLGGVPGEENPNPTDDPNGRGGGDDGGEHHDGIANPVDGTEQTESPGVDPGNVSPDDPFGVGEMEKNEK
jgi:hypothetical protein